MQFIPDDDAYCRESDEQCEYANQAFPSKPQANSKDRPAYPIECNTEACIELIPLENNRADDGAMSGREQYTGIVYKPKVLTNIPLYMYSI